MIAVDERSMVDRSSWIEDKGYRNGGNAIRTNAIAGLVSFSDSDYSKRSIDKVQDDTRDTVARLASCSRFVTISVEFRQQLTGVIRRELSKAIVRSTRTALTTSIPTTPSLL